TLSCCGTRSTTCQSHLLRRLLCGCIRCYSQGVACWPSSITASRVRKPLSVGIILRRENLSTHSGEHRTASTRSTPTVRSRSSSASFARRVFFSLGTRCGKSWSSANNLLRICEQVALQRSGREGLPILGLLFMVRDAMSCAPRLHQPSEVLSVLRCHEGAVGVARLIGTDEPRKFLCNEGIKDGLRTRFEKECLRMKRRDVRVRSATNHVVKSAGRISDRRQHWRTEDTYAQSRVTQSAHGPES